jgi:glycosyltransferase involved in cell wall biosynthesis
VLFRPSPIDRDTRAKKTALTLHRGGYDVVVLSAVDADAPADELCLGPVRVLQVPQRRSHAEDLQRRMLARRRHTYRPFVRMPVDEYKARWAESRGRVRQAQEPVRSARARAASGPVAQRALGWLQWVPARVWLTLQLLQSHLRRVPMRLQGSLNRRVRTTWRRFDLARSRSALLATDRGVLPELDDLADSFGPVLDELAPSVLHAHHPTVLPTALRAARRLRAGGLDARVVYDARENYAGIPPEEQGNARRHAVLLRQERRCIGAVDAVITVSEPIAEELQQRYGLARRPTVVLNAPVLAPSAPTPTVREVAGVAAGVPLMVYSGAVSRVRGVELLVDALVHLPEVHLVLVTVPFPHPLLGELRAHAAALGVAERVHAAPPVGQDELVGYLADADVAVHPLPGGSPNHDQAMPNKLFEYLHAGLPLVVSDARLMADFVRRHDLGEVFPSGDAAGLADAVRRALARPADAARRAELAGQFSWQGQEAALLEVYAAVTGRPAAALGDAAFPALDVHRPGHPDERGLESPGAPEAGLLDGPGAA